MDTMQRERLLAYFDRLGERKVRLYSAIDCERFFGDWQARELADDWLEQRLAERRSRHRMRWPGLRRTLSRA